MVFISYLSTFNNNKLSSMPKINKSNSFLSDPLWSQFRAILPFPHFYQITINMVRNMLLVGVGNSISLWSPMLFSLLVINKKFGIQRWLIPIDEFHEDVVWGQQGTRQRKSSGKFLRQQVLGRGVWVCWKFRENVPRGWSSR